MNLNVAYSLLEGVRQRRTASSSPKSALLLWIFAGLVVGIILLPILYLFIRALGADRQAWAMVLQANTLWILLRTAWLALTVTAASVLLAVPLAWLTVRSDLPQRKLWAVLTALPLVIPSYVGAYLVVASLGPRGMLARWLAGWLGISELPSIYGFPGALFVLTLLSYPYTLLSVRAALQGMDPALEEAARSLGYGPWKTFWRVTLPQLRPALAASSLLVALYVLRDFGAVSILRYDTFTRVIYLQYRTSFDRSAAAVLSLLLVGLTLAILALDRWSRSRLRYDSDPHGARRRLPVTPLGRWRWPAVMFCALVVLLGLVIPSGTLLYWLVRGLQAGERLTSAWPAAWSSLLVSALASMATLLAALPVVVLSVRRPGRWSLLLERLSYAGFALPGIVIALALVYFGTNYALSLYQTLPMLVMAYVILFLPQAVGALRASLLQVPPILEEAARGLGRRPAQVFLAVTLPLLRPGALAGAGLVFLTTMKELPATLILSPLGVKTLAMSVWTEVSEAFFARAAFPALILILASSLPMAFLISKERK